MAALTTDQLRQYVAGGQQVAPANCVLLTITHNYLKAKFVEICFNKHSTINDVKDTVYQHTGTPQDFQVLTLNGITLADMNKKLGFYSPSNGDIIHCLDTDPHSKAAGGWLEDVSLVKKYVMTDEEYNKRPVTYRKFKAEQLAKDPNWKTLAQRNADKAKKQALAAAGLEEKEYTLEEAQAAFKIGARCEVWPGARRGAVRYVGLVPQIGGAMENAVWVGVEFDEPQGKGDGTKKGKRYFQAAPGQGGFIVPYRVRVGDYPERDPFASDDEDDDEDEVVAQPEETEVKEGEEKTPEEDVMEEL